MGVASSKDEPAETATSPLRAALEAGDAGLFKQLAEAGARIVPVLEGGLSVLHYAVLKEHVEVVKVILRERSLFPNLKNARDQRGRTALHIAAEACNAELVALLLKYNSQPDLKDNLGQTPKDLVQAIKHPLAKDIIEQLSVEDWLVLAKSNDSSNCPMNYSRSRGSQGSASTLRSTEDQDTDEFSFLEKALQRSQVPFIKSSDLTLNNEINRGSSCIVYKGMWRGTDVAVKRFHAEYSSNLKESQKFVKEMQVLASVRHPNLLLLMGVAVMKPHLCIVTEFVPYCSLFYALHKNKTRVFSFHERMHVAVQLCKGLAYLHGMNPPILHRDLKPENCLLDHSCNLKIADFGLARPLSSFMVEEMHSMTTTCIGTTRFMAPELFDKDRVEGLTEAVDIWSLGCVLIELFSNKRPWDYISSSNVSCIYYEIFQQKPIPVPENIPSSLRELISQCCRYDPKARPSAVDVLGALEELI